MRPEVQLRMQQIIDHLKIPLKVVWIPNPENRKHGIIEVDSGTLFIFDVKEEDAWQTFIHEILEWKFKSVTRVYRTIINSLIEALEKVVYSRKEEFLEFLPELFKQVELIGEEKRIEKK